MVQGIANLLRVVEAHHNHLVVGVEELVHHSQKGLGHLSDWWVEGELLCLVVTEVVMGMVMIMEGVVDHLPQGEIKEMAVMEVMMEMVVGEMIHHHHQIKGNHNAAEIGETDGYMSHAAHCPLTWVSNFLHFVAWPSHV